jgi:hypothetical protein
MPSEYLRMFRALRDSKNAGNSLSSLHSCSVDAPTISYEPNEAIEAIGTQLSKGSSGGAESAAAPNLQVDWRELFEERAAIRKCGGLYSRAEAEVLAWGELQNRWHIEHGDRIPRDVCAGCRRPIGNAEALDLIDGSRVHLTDANGCLIRHGSRWSTNATRALMAVGLRPPPAGSISRRG